VPAAQVYSTPSCVVANNIILRFPDNSTQAHVSTGSNKPNQNTNTNTTNNNRLKPSTRLEPETHTSERWRSTSRVGRSGWKRPFVEPTLSPQSRSSHTALRAATRQKQISLLSSSKALRDVCSDDLVMRVLCISLAGGRHLARRRRRCACWPVAAAQRRLATLLREMRGFKCWFCSVFFFCQCGNK
jgi:hypothetical protein